MKDDLLRIIAYIELNLDSYRGFLAFDKDPNMVRQFIIEDLGGIIDIIKKL